MKSIRKIDKLGRITLPSDMRKSLNIKHGDALEMFISDNEIVFKKHSPEYKDNK